MIEDDDIVLEFIEHPRDTVLGMTLLIESYIPEAAPKQINMLAVAVLEALLEKKKQAKN